MKSWIVESKIVNGKRSRICLKYQQIINRLFYIYTRSRYAVMNINVESNISRTIKCRACVTSFYRFIRITSFRINIVSLQHQWLTHLRIYQRYNQRYFQWKMWNANLLPYSHDKSLIINSENTIRFLIANFYFRLNWDKCIECFSMRCYQIRKQMIE